MSEWKEYKLGEVVELSQGLAINKQTKHLLVDKGLPLLRITDLFTDNYSQFIDAEKVPKQCIASLRDIIYTRTGQVGYVFRNKHGVIHNNCFKVKPKDLLDNDFLFWFLKQSSIKDLANNIASGSVQLDLPHSAFKTIDILIPNDKNEQKQIANTLNSIEDKICLLQNQINVLEQLAETLFRQWFIEEATTEEEVTLDEFVNTVNGYSYKSSELNPSENALVTLKSFNRNGSFRLNGFKEFTGPVKQHQTVKQGDLIVSHTDITQEAEVIGNPALVIEDPRYKQLVITMDMVKVVPKDDRLSIPFLYFLMRTPEFKFHCLGCSNGTTVLHMSKSAIPTFSFPKPDFEKVKTFTEYAGNLLEKTFKNHAQIRSLNNFRDTILPKLMSGEATIKE